MLTINFIIIANIISNIFSIIKIPFKYYSTSQLFPNQSDPVTDIYMSRLLIEISIGNPPQKINCSLNLNSFYSLFLSHEMPNIELSSFYNKTLSSTYNIIQEKKYYWNEDFDQAEIFSDKIQIFSSYDNKNIINDKRFTFLLIDGLGYNIPNEFYSSGLIGLRLKKENDMNQINENRFIYQIKKQGLINDETFYFEFNKNDNNGFFILGEELFNNDNYLKINVGNLYMPNLGPEWSFNFDQIYYGNNEIKETTDALIKTENGLIIGPTTFEIIINEFFKSEKKCESIYKKMGYATFKYYYCNEDFDENTMEDLVFEMKAINYNFTFHGKDLFYTYNKTKYYKILFFNSYRQQPYWYLGTDFLKKYKLRFDTDRKLLYIPLNNDVDSKDNNDNNDNNGVFSIFKKLSTWIIIGFGLIIICLIIVIIIILAKYPRKKRANELSDDNFDYSVEDQLYDNIN